MKYQVTFQETVHWFVDVEAKSEEEAEKRAYEMLLADARGIDSDSDGVDPIAEDIEEITEE